MLFCPFQALYVNVVEDFQMVRDEAYRGYQKGPAALVVERLEVFEDVRTQPFLPVLTCALESESPVLPIELVGDEIRAFHQLLLIRVSELDNSLRQAVGREDQRNSISRSALRAPDSVHPE